MTLILNCWNVAILLFILYVAAHITLTRRYHLGPTKQVRLQAMLATIFLVGATCIIITLDRQFSPIEVNASHPPDAQLIRLFTSLMFLLGSFGLSLSFYSGLDHSVRIRLCCELYELDRPVTIEELERLYGVEAADQRRLEKLFDSGFVTQISDSLHLTEKGRRMARLLKAARSLYL